MEEHRRATGVRIGELARRTGTSPELLRAWELRYGLLRPARSQGGFRLYSDEDEARVRRTVALIEEGLSAAEAAARAIEEGSGPVGSDGPALEGLAASLRDALDRFDGEAANAAFDRLLSVVSVDVLLRDVVLPFLHELGNRWERGEASIAQEHFASNVLRGRLLGLARDWGAPAGPAVVLACPPGEEHDLGLVVFGIAIARRGRRVVFLGANTPVAQMADAARQARDATLVVAVTRPEPLRAASEELRAVARERQVCVCGAGASEQDALAVGARALLDDPVTAAAALASG